MKSNEGLENNSIKVKFTQQKSKTIFKFGDRIPTLEEILKKCRKRYKDKCEFVLSHPITKKEIQNEQAFQELFQQIKNNDNLNGNLFIVANIVGGKDKYKEVEHIIAAKKSQKSNEGSKIKSLGQKGQEKESEISKKDTQNQLSIASNSKQPSKVSHSAKLQQPKYQYPINQSSLITNQQIKEHKEQQHLTINKDIQEIKNQFKQFIATKNPQASLQFQKIFTKAQQICQVSNKVAQKQIIKGLKCLQCQYNIKGQFFICLLCPKVMICRLCEHQQELDNHPIRAHPLIKIKNKHQFHQYQQIRLNRITAYNPPNIPIPTTQFPSSKGQSPQEKAPQNQQLINRNAHPQGPRYSSLNNQSILLDHSIQLLNSNQTNTSGNQPSFQHYVQNPSQMNQTASRTQKSAYSYLINDSSNKMGTKLLSHNPQNTIQPKIQSEKFQLSTFQQQSKPPSNSLTPNQQREKMKKLKLKLQKTSEQLQPYFEGEFKDMTYSQVIDYIREHK